MTYGMSRPENTVKEKKKEKKKYSQVKFEYNQTEDQDHTAKNNKRKTWKQDIDLQYIEAYGVFQAESFIDWNVYCKKWRYRLSKLEYGWA